MSGSAVPKPPAHLSKRGAGLWKSIVAEFDLGNHQLEILRRACEASDRTDEAVAIIKAEGLVVTDRHGQSKPHPATQIERDSRIAVARLFRELALEPGAEDPRPPRTGEAGSARSGRG